MCLRGGGRRRAPPSLLTLDTLHCEPEPHEAGSQSPVHALRTPPADVGGMRCPGSASGEGIAAGEPIMPLSVGSPAPLTAIAWDLKSGWLGHNGPRAGTSWLQIGPLDYPAVPVRSRQRAPKM